MLMQPGLIQPDPTERYTFGAYIKRGDNTVLDIAVEAINTPESIRKAISTVRRAMTSHAPDVTPIVIAADKIQSAHTVAQAAAAPEPATTPTSAASSQEQKPQSPTILKPDKPLEGVRGPLHLHCEGCGKTLATFLKVKQQAITCRCGHTADLTKPLARFHYTCRYCESERWGLTNVEDADISVKCKCGGMVDMQWEPKAKEYRN